MEKSKRARRRKLETSKMDLKPPCQCLSLAAQEMRAGPSGSACRSRSQTALELLGLRALVVSVQGKGEAWISSGVSREDERE